MEYIEVAGVIPGTGPGWHSMNCRHFTNRIVFGKNHWNLQALARAALSVRKRHSRDDAPWDYVHVARSGTGRAKIRTVDGR